MKLTPGGKRIWPSAEEGARAARHHVDSEQCRSDAYRLAFQDDRFLLRDELRPVRLQLELLKPELILQEEGIESTVVVFGSARIKDAEGAAARLAGLPKLAAGGEPDAGIKARLARARRDLSNSRYYEEARKLGRLVSTNSAPNRLVVVTGGGPGIMEAANRGARDAGSKTIGMNIVLPHEQAPNPFVSPELCFQFHYFAIRKMHLIMRAKSLVAFPGGFGTLDELFETLTLIQTHKVESIPVLLFDEAFWKRAVDFDALVEVGTISPSDLDLFQFVESAEQAWSLISSQLERRSKTA